MQTMGGDKMPKVTSNLSIRLVNMIKQHQHTAADKWEREKKNTKFLRRKQSAPF